MYCSLKKFGFQGSLLRWINTLYTDIKGCILNNGWISRPFNIERGIRQGCPASSIIFVIAVEILASRLRQNKSFKGFQIKLDNKTHTLKLSQLADDTTLFLNSKQEVSLTLNIIEIFGSLSGLKLNRNKTEGIWLGNLKSCKDKVENINFTQKPIKVLGIYFGLNKNECKKLNLQRQYEKSEKIIKDWNKRNLTMLGKITLVKSLILPNITYVASVTEIDKEYLAKFKKIIYSFIWNNKSEKVKRDIISKNYHAGGLKMINIDKYLEAINISWVKKLIENEDLSPNWKVLPRFYFDKFGQEFLIFKMNFNNINLVYKLKELIPQFYLRIIKSWINTKSEKELDHLSYKQIRQQLIWGNKNIKLNGKCLIFKNWINSKILFLNDIIDNKGKFNQNMILDKLSCHANWFSEYSKLMKAIPKQWLQELTKEESLKTKVTIDSEYKFKDKKGKMVSLKNISSKDIYISLLNRYYEKPIGFQKWDNIFILENNTNKRQQMLNYIFYYIQDNKFKMLRWKFLHYILPTKQLLFSWKITKTPLCNICDVIEDYEHYFLTCKFLKSFWDQIKLLLDKLKIGHHIISIKSLLYGYKINDTSYYSINDLITIIIFTVYKGYYISEQKTKQINMFEIFKKEFLQYHEILINKEGKYEKFHNLVAAKIKLIS